MALKIILPSLPVLLIHNIDPIWEPFDIDQALTEVSVLESSLRDLGHQVTTVTIDNPHLYEKLHEYDPEKYIVFNWCEEIPGIPQSEALSAEMLERLKFTYTGSPPEILKLCREKRNVKHLLNLNGLASPAWRIYDAPYIDGWDCFPAIVKPSAEHCSLGVTKDAVVMSAEEMEKRITYIIETFKQPALVEDFIDGREFHITVWGNDDIEMLPPAEMDFAAFNDLKERLCTYESKFKPGSYHYEKIELRLPAPLTEEEYKRLWQASVSTYRSMGCRDYARLDIRLREGIFYILDVNPNPDVSFETSMAYAAETSGYTYGEMISHIISMAAKRHPKYRNFF